MTLPLQGKGREFNSLPAHSTGNEMDIITLIIGALWLVIPAYVANSTPVVLHGKTPIDFNKKFFDSKPILGKGKTWGGLISGISVGTFMAYIQNYLWNSYSLQNYGLIEMTVLLGFALSFGALIGDILASFIKRRRGIERGGKFRILDRFSFLIFALIFASLIIDIKLEIIIILLIITPFLHKGMNLFAYKVGLKKVPH